MKFCQNIPTWLWASFFKNLKFFHFSWHILIGIPCSHDFFFLMQRYRLDKPPRYLEHFRKVHKKFLDALSKKVSPQKWSLVRIFQSHVEVSFFRMIVLNCFFYAASRIFSVYLTSMSKFSKWFGELWSLFR